MPTNGTDKWAEARRRALADIANTSDEEDARITAAALADPDAQPWTDEMWARSVTWEERHKRRADARAKAAAEAQTEDPLEIDPDVVEHFRKTGRGWQGRINDVLRKAAGLG